MNKYEQHDFSIHDTLCLFFMLYCFNFLCLTVLEKFLKNKKYYEKFKVLKTGEKEKRNKVMNSRDGCCSSDINGTLSHSLRM